jgi:hypothetical protein
MSDESSESKKKALDALIGEAKEDFAPRDVDIHWGRVEEKMMARIAEEEPPLLRDRRAVGTGRARALRATAIALAAAAAVAVVVRRDRDTSLVDANAPAVVAETQNASALRSTEGAGEIRISGMAATTGHVLKAGDAIEADRARGVFERARKVAWLIENDDEKAPAKANVKSAGESLVLGLEDGAIEAQVTPVASGEAFAVDVTSGGKLVRVAVHGTHLRVTRHGRKVTVDLTEGVVSIGVPPRTGTTIGTLVTAPAHVELDAEDLDRSIKVDHTAAAVRAAIPLAVTAPAAAPHEPATAAPRSDLPAGVVTKPAAIAHAPPAKPEPARAAVEPAKPTNVEVAAPAPPREEIAKAVRACAAAKNRASEVKVTVTSTLKLKVSATGEVQTAQFDPPLMPDVQACAATAIYKTQFGQETGLVTVPIEFSY